MNRNFFPVFLLLVIWLTSCGPDSTTESDENDQPEMVNLSITVSDPSGTPISPVMLTIYSANQGTEGEPDAIHTGNENGVIEALIRKNYPAILKVAGARHQPVKIFIPTTTLDELSLEVVPATVLTKPTFQPAVIGDFNHYDPFSKVKMDQNEDGLWAANVYSEQSEIRYQITDFAYSQPIHGSYGLLKVDTDLPGIVSILEPDEVGIARILFDPSQFPASERRATLRFSTDVSVTMQGVSKLYAAMQEQVDLVEAYKDNEDRVVELFNDYLDHIDLIKESFEHHIVEQAHRLAKARFSEYLQVDSEFIDQLLSDLDPNSELWLFNPRFVHDLFSYSSKMEPVSKSLWDIYRQHHFDEVQSEALYSLLNFHYDRGEDEEWYEAHFELVRSYPQSKRINYSYREGFAPESVVHIGRYFPGLAFGPLESQADSLRPADISSSLTILYFWSFEDPEFEEQFEVLKILQDRFSDQGIEIIPIALDEDRSRVERFHQFRNHSWRAGLEGIINPQIQVLGITNTPYTLFLDGNRRVLYRGESILEDELLLEYVDDFYSD